MNYQDRNTASQQPVVTGWPVPPLGIPVQATTFTATVTKAQGNWGTPADGWDDIYTPIVAGEPQHAALVEEMSAGISKAQFTPGAISKELYAPIGVQIADLVPIGNQQFNKLLEDLTLQASPQPGGGGGSGGGGGGGGSGSEPVEPGPGGCGPGPHCSGPEPVQCHGLQAADPGTKQKYHCRTDPVNMRALGIVQLLQQYILPKGVLRGPQPPRLAPDPGAKKT